MFSQSKGKQPQQTLLAGPRRCQTAQASGQILINSTARREKKKAHASWGRVEINQDEPKIEHPTFLWSSLGSNADSTRSGETGAAYKCAAPPISSALLLSSNCPLQSLAAFLKGNQNKHKPQHSSSPIHFSPTQKQSNPTAGKLQRRAPTIPNTSEKGSKCYSWITPG